MNLPVFIARRYLFAKKSQNVINIISGISVVGVVLGTMALIVVLSIFNGFEDLTESLYHTFDSDLKITTEKGKTFTPDSVTLATIKGIDGVKHVSQIVEENVLINYAERQAIAVMKGVDEEYEIMTSVHNAVYEGNFNLHYEGHAMAVVGRDLASSLNVGLRFIDPMFFYVPRRGGEVSLANPAENLNSDPIYPAGFFAIEKSFDEKYVFVPISFARGLLEYTTQVTSIEIMLDSMANVASIQKHIGTLMGSGFVIKDRYQQNASVYRMMRLEKTMIYCILIFIILIISFNVTGSLFMLIIEKKKDIVTFRNIGANDKLIRRIFLYEGWFISLIGMTVGVLLGLCLCLLQQYFGLLKLPGGMIIDAYPVAVHWGDVVLVVLSVAAIGYFAARIAIAALAKQLKGDASP